MNLEVEIQTNLETRRNRPRRDPRVSKFIRRTKGICHDPWNATAETTGLEVLFRLSRSSRPAARRASRVFFYCVFAMLLFFI